MWYHNPMRRRFIAGKRRPTWWGSSRIAEVDSQPAHTRTVRGPILTGDPHCLPCIHEYAHAVG
eukprot:3159429-Pyramimonas_sp.AAC.1